MLDKLWSVQEPEIIERKIQSKSLEEVYLLLKELLKHDEVDFGMLHYILLIQYFGYGLMFPIHFHMMIHM